LLDLPPISDENTTVHGQLYWRSLEEYADSQEFRELLSQEFAGYDPDEIKSMSRRRFMLMMGASMALAGLTAAGCRRLPEQKLAPYANRPAGRSPGAPQQYATMMERCGVATGLLVSSFDGRPIKIEGNPQHPYSLGATDSFAQASVLQMYDPDRSRSVSYGKNNRQRSNWQAFEKFARDHFAALKNAGGSAAILSQASSSPSLQQLKKRVIESFPGAKWYEWEPVNRDNELSGSGLAFGKAVRPQYHLDQARIFACFDSDLIGSHPAWLRHAHDWADGRRSADVQQTMNRLYVAESSLSLTGSVADERLAVRSAKIPQLLEALAARVGVAGSSEVASLNGSSAFIEALAADLKKHRGQAIVVAGPHHSAQVHQLVWAINDALGNLGSTITMIDEPNDSGTTNLQDITELTARINAGEVKTLVILGGNPVYDAPADLQFAEALDRVETSIHLSLYFDETSQHCLWHLPQAHDLESWGDGRAWDGTLSVQQPLILPLFDGRTATELLALALGDVEQQGYDIVRKTFSQYLPALTFEAAWRKVLHDGLLADSAAKPLNLRPSARPSASLADVAEPNGFEVRFVPDGKVFDGRYANNGWLQETPDSLTKATWDNFALINVAEAVSLGIRNGEMIELSINGRTLAIAAYLMPGQATGSIAVALGYGRTAAGHVGNGVGFDAYQLRTSSGLGIAQGASVAGTGKLHPLALTQNHYLIDWVGQKATEHRVGEKGKSGTIIKEASLAQYKRRPNFATQDEHGDIHLQMYEGPLTSEPAHPGAPAMFNSPHAWGMAVDMNTCIGCNGCVVACQAENNIPVVGKDQVLMSREMQWIRIDRYFKADKSDPSLENPQVVHQPMMCQQCENAPCEEVCPVAATVHDTEGLNTMVYNRCIGTRYCSNNCPYKVRRFNYFDFHSKDPRGAAKPWLNMPDMQQQKSIDQIKQMVFNPDVTVRMRGVMEKCTYCVQRIARAKSHARLEYVQGKRPEQVVMDGEVVTACQQACPTQAIVFGDLNDANSRVSQIHKKNRAYGVLADLNTRPRTKYLAKLRNPAEGVSHS
jgi:molybdopterin-containing oxidoreductase family iron-sulfur binding subunit